MARSGWRLATIKKLICSAATGIPPEIASGQDESRRHPARLLIISDSGVGALVKFGAWLSHRLDLEVLSCGRAGLAPKDSCNLELTGKHLLFDLTIEGGFIFLSAQLLDRGDPPESLASFADGLDGWKQICAIVRCLERDQIKSLAKPIELCGGSGPNGWVIS